MQEDGNIMDFYVNGDVAPSGRFNYHYFTDHATGLSENKKSSFRIYPNPAKEMLTVIFPSGSEKNSVLTIYNPAGQQVWQRRITGPALSEQINLGFLKKGGLYIVELRGQGSCEREKLIVN